MQLVVMPGDTAFDPDQRLDDLVGAGRVLRIVLACHAAQDRRPVRRLHLAKPVDRWAVVQRLGHLFKPSKQEGA